MRKCTHSLYLEHRTDVVVLCWILFRHTEQNHGPGFSSIPARTKRIRSRHSGICCSHDENLTNTKHIIAEVAAPGRKRCWFRVNPVHRTGCRGIVLYLLIVFVDFGQDLAKIQKQNACCCCLQFQQHLSILLGFVIL